LSDSFEFDEPDVFTAGTEGPAGQRIFYLQVRNGPDVVSVKLEKQQVAALGEHLARLVSDLPTIAPEALPTDLDLLEPVIPQWVVGPIGVAYDDDLDRVVLIVEELVDEEAGEDSATLRIRVKREQVLAFVERAEELMSSGRPTCPLCGRPQDPDGHICPRSNGHLRGE